MDRRRFLGSLTAASLGVALKGSFTEFARAQNTAPARIPPELHCNFNGPCGVGRRLLLEQHYSSSRATRS